MAQHVTSADWLNLLVLAVVCFVFSSLGAYTALRAYMAKKKRDPRWPN